MGGGESWNEHIKGVPEEYGPCLRYHADTSHGFGYSQKQSFQINIYFLQKKMCKESCRFKTLAPLSP